jgi:hypothetical protein
MGKGFCPKCKGALEEGNCSPVILESGFGKCNSCRLAYDRERRADPEIYARRKSTRKKYEQENKEKIQAYQHQYDLENKERKKAWRKKHIAENRELYASRSLQSKLKNPDRYKEQRKILSETIKGRHNSLRHALRRDSVDESDLLWSIRFYESLIQDKECHYCLGPLERTGGGLDRKSNGLGHTCYNVVPCCRKCNRIKGNDTSYEEMMLLAPVLREIRLKRSAPV